MFKILQVLNYPVSEFCRKNVTTTQNINSNDLMNVAMSGKLSTKDSRSWILLANMCHQSYKSTSNQISQTPVERNEVLKTRKINKQSNFIRHERYVKYFYRIFCSINYPFQQKDI